VTKRVQFIRHVKSAADLFLGFIGEITVNLTDSTVRVHDGATVGGIEQARKDLANVSAADAGADGKMTAVQATAVAQATTDIATINSDHIGVAGIAEHPDVVAAGASSFMSGADKTKLDGIETAAKDDLSAAEILTLLLTVDGAGSGLDADLLDGLNSAAAATVSTIMRRDSAGRGKVVDGAVAGDIATKGQVDIKANSAITILPAAGSGLAGGGSLAANRTFNLDINSLAPDTVAAGDLVPIEDISGGADKKVTIQSIADLSPAYVNPLTLLTKKTATSTAVDFTGIASTVKRITIMFDQVSLSGTDEIEVQLGDAGGFETTGYVGSVNRAAASATAFSSGFQITINGVAADVQVGVLVLTLFDSTNNIWVGQSEIGEGGGQQPNHGAGRKALTATLTQIRIKPTGANSFDAGEINLMVE